MLSVTAPTFGGPNGMREVYQLAISYRVEAGASNSALQVWKPVTRNSNSCEIDDHEVTNYFNFCEMDVHEVTFYSD